LRPKASPGRGISAVDCRCCLLETLNLRMAGTVLLDIDGVLTVSGRALPGAGETLAWLRYQGIGFGLVTNTSSKSRREIAAVLTEVGMHVDAPRIFTAVSSAARYLHARYPGARCLVINEGSLDDDLTGVDTVGADSVGVVLLGGAGASIGYRELDAVFKLALNDVPVVALHRNSRFQTAEGPALDMGAFVIGLEAAAGIDIPIVGKPAPEFFRSALLDLGAEVDEVVIVGDDIDSDVRGGQAVGMTGVLVKTGKYRRSDLDTEGPSPDHVIEDIGQLPELLGELSSDRQG
jgi:HAD superfamily hydrolase (TIGR01458 family)